MCPCHVKTLTAHFSAHSLVVPQHSPRPGMWSDSTFIIITCSTNNWLPCAVPRSSCTIFSVNNNYLALLLSSLVFPVIYDNYVTGFEHCFLFLTSISDLLLAFLGSFFTFYKFLWLDTLNYTQKNYWFILDISFIVMKLAKVVQTITFLPWCKLVQASLTSVFIG